MRTITTLALAALLTATVPVGTADLPFFTLSISGPGVVLEGTQATFEGRWRAAFVGYDGYDVSLYVDGERAGQDFSFMGEWRIVHAFPARGDFEVYAVGDEGLPTETRSPTITVRVAGEPGPVGNLSAVPVAGQVAARVSWSAPLDDGGAPVTSYVVERRGVLRLLPHDDSGWVRIATLAGDTLTHLDDDLGTGITPMVTNYTYRVTASNGAGKSPAVETPVTTDPIGQPTVTVTPDSPSRTNVTIEAASTGGPTQYLIVARSDDGGTTWKTVGEAVGTSATFYRTMLDDAVPVYRGHAVSIASATPGEIVSAQGEVPGAPTAVHVTVDDTVVVHWTLPADGGPAQRYQVLEDGVPIASRPHHARNASFIGTPGTHAYTVVARNVVGAGPASAPASLTLSAASAPEALAGTVIEEDRWARVQLEWTAPLDDGGAPIQGYHVYRRTGETGSLLRVGATNATTFRFEEDHLSDNVTHHYEVRAHTAVGDGAAATYDAVVSDYDWQLTQSLTRFTLCEGATCTEVGDGGTYTRTHGGAVTYAADLHGLLTRKGVPMEGRGVLVTMWEEGNDEFASSEGPTTDAHGEYDAHWRGDTVTPAPGCKDVVLVTTAQYWPEWRRYEHRFTLCA